MKTYHVFEYGYLSPGKLDDPRCITIPKAAFDYLEECCLNLSDQGEANLPFLQYRSLRSSKVIQVKNYVGILSTPQGVQIEILPKIGKTGNDEKGIPQSRQMLLTMLSALRDFKHLETQSANVATTRLPLFEVFVGQFLNSVNNLVKRGLRSDYVAQQDNLNFQKGKLLVAQQLKHNLTKPHKFCVEYDEYLQNRPENRLLHSALKKVAGYTRSLAHQRLCRELDFAFSDVPLSLNVKRDLAAIRLDRGMNDYQTPLAWAAMILEGITPMSMQGSENAVSLLFPMEKVFEAYVAKILRRQLKPEYQLQTQASSKALVSHGQRDFFRLMPDLLIRQGNVDRIVLDTKWKLIDSSKSNSSNKYDLSQADFYQMFAYGHKYLNGEGELYLIYPAHDGFSQPIERSFDFGFDEGSKKKLTLWVVP
ncbi:McrC family protein, partial [Pseudomonadota bacterium]